MSRLAGVLLAMSAPLLTLAACTDDAPPAPPPAETSATPTPTALSDYDTDGLTLQRTDFCERVAAAVVDAALASADGVVEILGWVPGDRLPGSREVGNEFGCQWAAGTDGDDVVTARAWIFAPPVTPARAADFAAETVGTKCRRLRSAPALGDHSVAQRCTLNTGSELVGVQGLVGDAWVACEISGPSDIESDRVGEWCVGVLEALRA